MKTSTLLVAACLAASLPAQAQVFKPIEVKDSELAGLRGRYVMPGRIISFGVVMNSTWQNANGDRIGATATMHVQQNTFKPQFYVSLINDKGTGNSMTPGTGSVSGGSGLNNTQGVTQTLQAAGDYNTAYNNVSINVKESKTATANGTPSGQVLAGGSSISGSNGAGTLNISAGANGIKMGINASNNQGYAVQSLAQGGLSQAAVLLGGNNVVSNMTQLNVVLRDNMPTAGALNCNLDQLKGLRISGY